MNKFGFETNFFSVCILISESSTAGNNDLAVKFGYGQLCEYVRGNKGNRSSIDFVRYPTPSLHEHSSPMQSAVDSV